MGRARYQVVGQQLILETIYMVLYVARDLLGPRFLVEKIYPSVDDGRYPVKRIVG